MAQTYRLPLHAASEERGDAAGIESLAEQISMDSPEDGGVAQVPSVAQATVQRLLQQRAFIDLAEYLRDGLARDIAIDAERFDVADNTRAAPMSYVQLSSRAGNGRTAIVNRLFMAKARDRGVDIVWFKLAAREPVAELSFGEFAPGEKRQAGDVRLLCASGHQWVAGLSGAIFSVISMAVPQGSTT
jgi:hypothetical protein